MNPLYNMLMGNQQPQPQPQATGPMQRINTILQAMRNPAAFVKQAIPDIPANIQNDPGQILQYLQQTRGISNEQIQQLINQIPHP